MSAIFKIVGMHLIDLEHLSTHGDSMKFFFAKDRSRNVTADVQRVLKWEYSQGLDHTETFLALAKRVERNTEFLKQVAGGLQPAGKTVAAVEAPSNSTTVYIYDDIA